MMKKNLYDQYHSRIKIQKRIISSGDFVYRNTLDKISKYIQGKKTMLDVGSATGTISFYFVSKGLSVDGIELSKNAVLYANKSKTNLSIKNVNFFNTTVEKFKTNKKYDLVVCLEVLEHIKDDLNCLNKIHGLLNDESILIISVPSINAPLYKLGLLNKFDNEVGHLRRYSMFELCNKLSKTGFKVVKKYKTEGIFRSLLFTNKFFGILIKLTRFKFVNNFFTNIDQLSLKVFPESQLILICKKR